MERSIQLIVSILSILKTGAAYVPIDPNYPEERKKYMIVKLYMLICLLIIIVFFFIFIFFLI